MDMASGERAPSAKIIIPYFVFSALSFFVFAVLLLLSSGDFNGFYFQPKLLSLVHIAAVGWATSIIFGSMYQFVPVVFEVKLFSEKLALATFILLICGISHIALAFWQFDTGWKFLFGATALFLSFLLFALNILMSVRTKKNIDIDGKAILISIGWMFLTGTLGLMLALNFRWNFISADHLRFLKMHAHFGAVGWMLMLIIGVSAKLMPMFSVSQGEKKIVLKKSIYLINLGLILLASGFFANVPPLATAFFSLIIILGIGYFLQFIWRSYASRLRKELDAGLTHSYWAFGLLAMPMVAGLALPFLDNTDFSLRLIIFYAASFFLGIVTTLILGQTYKIFPFIIWLWKFRSRIGFTQVCLPKDLLNEKVASLEGKVYIISLPLFLTGILANSRQLQFLGAFGIFVAASLYNYNIFRILLYAPKAAPASKKNFAQINLPVISQELR